MKKTSTSMKGMAMKAALKGMSTQSKKKAVTSMQGMAMKGDVKVAKGGAKKSVSPQKVTNALRAAMKAMKKVLGHEEDRIENWSWYDVRGVEGAVVVVVVVVVAILVVAVVGGADAVANLQERPKRGEWGTKLG